MLVKIIAQAAQLPDAEPDVPACCSRNSSSVCISRIALRTAGIKMIASSAVAKAASWTTVPVRSAILLIDFRNTCALFFELAVSELRAGGAADCRLRRCA